LEVSTRAIHSAYRVLESSVRLEIGFAVDITRIISDAEVVGCWHNANDRVDQTALETIKFYPAFM